LAGYSFGISLTVLGGDEIAHIKGVIATTAKIVSSLASLVQGYVQKPMAITGEEFEIEGPNGAHNVVMDRRGPARRR